MLQNQIFLVVRQYYDKITCISYQSQYFDKHNLTTNGAYIVVFFPFQKFVGFFTNLRINFTETNTKNMFYILFSVISCKNLIRILTVFCGNPFSIREVSLTIHTTHSSMAAAYKSSHFQFIFNFLFGYVHRSNAKMFLQE